jgi:hypothetical protein
MLNEYLPNELLKEELMKRDWFLSNVEKDNEWLGGNLIVPFKGAGASSVRFGQLTASNNIARDKYVRGNIASQPEVWGSLIFDARDLMEHGRLSEQNLLKILPDSIEDFSNHLRQLLSLSFTNGEHISKFTGDGTVGGTFTTDDPERFMIGQKIFVKDDDSAVSAACYVSAINMDTGVITIEDNRGSGVAVDLSAYTVAQNAKAYPDGALDQPLTSLRKSLLPASAGGSTQLYGVTKTAFPYTQAIPYDGSTVTAATFVPTLFDAWTKVKKRGKGNPSKAIMAYKHLGTVMKQTEATKGPYHIDQKSQKVSLYGWTEIDLVGVSGRFTMVALPEMDIDWVAFIDMKAFKLYSNGFVKKRVSPDGKEWYEVRNENGYEYIVDICFFGDMVLERPSICGVIYGIPNYA